MTSTLTKIIIAVAVTAVVLTIAVAVSGLYLGNQYTTKQFAFNLNTHPNNATAMQAQNLTISIDTSCIEGKPETVKLSANGGPNGVIFQFSNLTGTPDKTQSFSSFLTIVVPTYATPGFYPITISGTSGDGMYQSIFNLTILNNQIQVTGTVRGTSVDIAGRPSEDIYPTDIEFKSTSTNQTYEAKVHLQSDANGKPMKIGNYSIVLPNQQKYLVNCYFFSYPHFIPVPRVGLTEAGNRYFSVACGVGVNSTVANFTG